jgi:hypothetical protein
VSFDESTVKGQHVLLVDDLCDSGLTLLTVHQRVEAAGAASVRSLVLLDKLGRRKVRAVATPAGLAAQARRPAGGGGVKASGHPSPDAAQAAAAASAGCRACMAQPWD